MAPYGNTIRYCFRGDPQVVSRLMALPPSELAVPAILVYELQYGLLRLPAEASLPRLKALASLLTPMRSLAFGEVCATRAAQVHCHLEQQGTPIGPHDLLIAAIAPRHHAPLVSRHVREFSRVPGPQVLNWHEA